MSMRPRRSASGDCPLGVGDASERAASRQSSACPPPATASRARRGWRRAWRARPRRASGSSSRSARSPVSRAPGTSDAARSRACARRVAAPRELAPGQRSEVPREVGAPVAETDDAYAGLVAHSCCTAECKRADDALSRAPVAVERWAVRRRRALERRERGVAIEVDE